MRRPGPIFFLCLTAGCSDCDPPQTIACNYNDDCPADQQCRRGICEPVERRDVRSPDIRPEVGTHGDLSVTDVEVVDHKAPDPGVTDVRGIEVMESDRASIDAAAVDHAGDVGLEDRETADARVRDVAAVHDVVVQDSATAPGDGSVSDTVAGDVVEAGPGDMDPADPGVGDGAAAGPNLVFVTSGKYRPAELGGVVGARAICNQLAQDAGLSGNYVPWLSSSSGDAVDQLGGARGWVRSDGMPFVDRIEDLVAGKIFYPPRITELGVDVEGDDQTLTATTAVGTLDTTSTCGDWSEDSGVDTGGGYASGTTQVWTDKVVGNCLGYWRLYCFQIDHVREVIPAAEGRLAFLSTVLFQPGPGGIDAADLLCQEEADLFGRGGTFKALLAVEGASAASRFTPGPAWVRPDGVTAFTHELLATGLATVEWTPHIGRGCSV